MDSEKVSNDPCSLVPTDGAKILETVLLHSKMDVKTLLKFRLVSSKVRNVIESKKGFRDGIAFHVNGEREGYCHRGSSQDPIPSPILTLVNTTFPRVHIKFSNLNLRRDFFDELPLFSKFTQQPYIGSLKSLTLNNVDCRMGPFIELVAQCVNLEGIEIVNCSTLFRAGSGVIMWGRFMKPFRQRLSSLKQLVIEDHRQGQTVLTQTTLGGWTHNMTQLVSLDLRVGYCCVLPISYLVQVLSRNEKTLKHVALGGKCGFDIKVSNVLCRLKLRSLSLSYTQLTSSIVLTCILGGQKELQTLTLCFMTISDGIFGTLAKLPKLAQLTLDCVTFEGGSSRGIVGLARSKSLTHLRLTDWRDPAKGDVWSPLFKTTPSFKLSWLCLRFANPGDLIQKPFLESLQTLVMIGRGKDDEEELESMVIGIRKVITLTTLVKLTISDSPLSDAQFPPPVDPTGPQVGTVRSFHNLKQLTHLDVSRTQIGNDALTLHFIHLEALEVLLMNETRVTDRGICTLLKRRGEDSSVLKSIRLISACGCSGLRMNSRRINLVQILLKAEFFCDVDDPETPEVEPEVGANEQRVTTVEIGEEGGSGDRPLSEVTQSYFS